MNAQRLLFGLSALLLVLASSARDARAFCRARTCDPRVMECDVVDECIVTGEELYWPSDCVTFAVQEDGSQKHGISATTVERTARAAFERWATAACPGGGQPSIHADYLGPVACGRSEFDDSVSNANIIVIRDEDWPYPGGDGVLGLTLLRFSAKTGRIDDADIEINGEDHALSVGDPVEGSDFAAILTHEIGHLLGLNHSTELAATMYARYTASDASGRSLSDDDVAGICAVYPPDRELERDDCVPVNGFSAECVADQEPRAPIPSPNDGCGISPRSGGRGSALCVLFGILGLAGCRFRRAGGRVTRPSTPKNAR